MTIVSVLLLTLGMPLQNQLPHSGPMASDSTRIAVAVAALEHAVFVAREDMGVPVERMFLSMGPRTDRVDPREWAGGDTVAFEAVAEEHGMEIQYFPYHSVFLACEAQDRRAEVCQARRVTSLSVGRAGILGPKQAFAWITIRTIPSPDGRRYSVLHQHLKLEKVGEAWNVVGVVETVEL